MDGIESLERPAWITAGATLISYGLVLLFLFLLLFVLPFVAYTQVLA